MFNHFDYEVELAFQLDSAAIWTDGIVNFESWKDSVEKVIKLKLNTSKTFVDLNNFILEYFHLTLTKNVGDLFNNKNRQQLMLLIDILF